MSDGPWLVAGWLLHRFRRLVERIDRVYWTHYYASRVARCGQGVRVNGRGTIARPDRLVLGDNVHIGSGYYFHAGGGLSIGDHTHISRNLLVYTVNHDIRGACLPYDDTLVERPVSIGRNVWIGMGVVVLPGTRIGDGVVIGAGAVVHGDIPDLAIVGAAVSQPIGQRDAEHYARLVREGRYGGASGKPLPAPGGRA